MRFIFLTRCFSPANLDRIRQNIREVFAGSEHTYTHLILADLTHGAWRDDFAGFCDAQTVLEFVDMKQPHDTQCTAGMDAALSLVGRGDEYVYVLDDDNLLHPDFLDVCEACGDADALVFKIAGRPELGNPSVMDQYPVGHIDWANFITRLDVMRELKIYYTDGPRRCEDGVFFDKMKQNHCEIRFFDRELAYYNKLPR